MIQHDDGCGIEGLTRIDHSTALRVELVARFRAVTAYFPGPPARQAALTPLRNFSTWILSRLVCPASDLAAESTCDEAPPVSAAPVLTSVMVTATSEVPVAAC